jgi:Na+/proline symporter
MTPFTILALILFISGILFDLSFYSGKDDSNAAFYNIKLKWYLVAFGMIGSTLSGVTFISVPGEQARLW